MKAMKKLFASVVIGTSLFTASVALAQDTAKAVAESKAERSGQEKPAVVIGEKVNINSATAAEIQKALIGIGAKKAEAIVQYREKHGAFTAAEQLLEVQGIGKATLEKNKDRFVF